MVDGLDEGIVPPDPDSVFAASRSHYTNYDAGVENFEIEDVVDREFVCATRHTQVWECHTDYGRFFVVEPTLRSGNSSEKVDTDTPVEGGTFSDGGEKNDSNTVFSSERKSRERAYELLLDIGAPMPPHKFTDDWIVSAAGPKSIDQHNRSESDDFRGEVDIDRFLTDCAKLLLMGHKDPQRANILLSPSGEYSFIDTHYSRSRYYVHVTRAHYKLGSVFRWLDLDSEVVAIASLRARGMAHLLKNDFGYLFNDDSGRKEDVVRRGSSVLPIAPDPEMCKFSNVTENQLENPWRDFWSS